MARRGGKDRGLFERPTGSGVWWIHYHDADGLKHRERVGPKGLARKRYMQRKTEIAEGRFFPTARTRRTLFEDLVDDYKRASARAGKAIMRTDAGYRRALEAFGGKRADAITAREIEEWRDRLAETLSPASVAHHLTMLRAIFNRGVRDGKLTTAPTRGVEFPRENNARVRYLTDDEEVALLSEIAERMRPLVTVAIHTGLREGELLRLRWPDVDLGSASLHVREAKSGDGRRLPLNQTALAALKEIRAALPKVVNLETRRDRRDSGYIFGPDSNALRMGLNREFRRATGAARIDDLHFHDLRHTFASRLVMRGFDLYRAQTLLGHKTQRMTMRYAHFSPVALREAVAALDRPAGAQPQSGR